MSTTFANYCHKLRNLAHKPHAGLLRNTGLQVVWCGVRVSFRLQCDAESPAAAVAGGDQGDAGLLCEWTVKVDLARVALPGLDADVGSPRPHPDAQVGAVGEIDAQTQRAGRAVGDRSAVEPVEHDRLLLEQLVAEAKNVSLDRGWLALRVQKDGIIGTSANRCGLVLCEDYDVFVLVASGRQRPVESGVEAEVRRHRVRAPAVADVAVGHLANKRKQDRSVVGPVFRIPLPQELLTLGGPERVHLGTVRVDPERQPVSFQLYVLRQLASHP